MDDSNLTIGEVANRAGLNVSAIRYYEAEGLLPAPPRVAGPRRYGDETLSRLRVIDVAKRAGFSLDDIRVLLESNDKGETAHNRLQELAERKLPEVDGGDTFDARALFSDASRDLDGPMVHVPARHG